VLFPSRTLLASLHQILGRTGWVDTPASRRSRAQMTSQEREMVPPVLLQPEEIAEAVVMFAKDETMAGRVMIWKEGEPWQIVPLDAPY
jgi:hypothetical protein